MEKIESYIGQEPPFDGINSLVLGEVRDKVNEIVDWINENELALVIIADWVAGKEKIFDKVVDQVEKERQAGGEHDPK